jgi:hypothetical protein
MFTIIEFHKGIISKESIFCSFQIHLEVVKESNLAKQLALQFLKHPCACHLIILMVVEHLVFIVKD